MLDLGTGLRTTRQMAADHWLRTVDRNSEHHLLLPVVPSSLILLLPSLLSPSPLSPLPFLLLLFHVLLLVLFCLLLSSSCAPSLSSSDTLSFNFGWFICFSSCCAVYTGFPNRFICRFLVYVSIYVCLCVFVSLPICCTLSVSVSVSVWGRP